MAAQLGALLGVLAALLPIGAMSPLLFGLAALCAGALVVALPETLGLMVPDTLDECKSEEDTHFELEEITQMLEPLDADEGSFLKEIEDIFELTEVASLSLSPSDPVETEDTP